MLTLKGQNAGIFKARSKLEELSILELSIYTCDIGGSAKLFHINSQVNKLILKKDWWIRISELSDQLTLFYQSFSSTVNSIELEGIYLTENSKFLDVKVFQFLGFVNGTIDINDINVNNIEFGGDSGNGKFFDFAGGNYIMDIKFQNIQMN